MEGRSKSFSWKRGVKIVLGFGLDFSQSALILLSVIRSRLNFEGSLKFGRTKKKRPNHTICYERSLNISMFTQKFNDIVNSLLLSSITQKPILDYDKACAIVCPLSSRIFILNKLPFYVSFVRVFYTGQSSLRSLTTVTKQSQVITLMQAWRFPVVDLSRSCHQSQLRTDYKLNCRDREYIIVYVGPSADISALL